MSLSKVFKGRGDFIPEQLVPRPGSPEQRWQPERLSREERTKQQNQAPETLSRVDQEPPGPASTMAEQPPQTRQAQPDTVADDETDPRHQPLADAGTAHEADEGTAIDLEPIREEAFQQGFQLGRKEGLEQAEQDFGSAVVALQQICEQLNTLRDTILKNSREEIVALIFALAESIIRLSVREQDKTIAATVEQALNQAVRSSEFSLYLNPDDIATIRERIPEFIAGVNGLEHLAVKQDAAIERGGCRIESETCTVDATIASQLDIIREQVKKQFS